MIKMMRFLFCALVITLLISGCNSTEPKGKDDLFQYKDSFVGENSAVGSIVNQLPGADHLNGFELKTNDEPYGIILNYDRIESEQEYKEIVIYNATFLIALVKNVDWITFNSEVGSYTISKESLLEWQGEEFNIVQDENELRELVYEYLQDENRVNQLLND